MQKDNREEIINLLDWLMYNDELLEGFIAGIITSEMIYNRYLDELKK
jgi:hypothetical protein